MIIYVIIQGHKSQVEVEIFISYFWFVFLFVLLPQT